MSKNLGLPTCQQLALKV